MLDLTSEQSAEAEAILAEIESSLGRFVKKAPKVNFSGCEFSLTLAVRQARECLEAVRGLRVTIFGEPKKSGGNRA